MSGIISAGAGDASTKRHSTTSQRWILCAVVLLFFGSCVQPSEKSGEREKAKDAGARVAAPDVRRERPREPGPPELAKEPEPPNVPMPKPPAGLVHYLTGSPRDARVTPKGPGLVMMGGSREVDKAFVWWKEKIAGGDVVILRASGSDGYNDYLYKEIGGCDSVVTLLVTTRQLASDPFVLWHLRRAEGIFIAGGDQSRYVNAWRGTPLQQALESAWRRGAVLGGTSAGLAILGEVVFSAQKGSVTSNEAMANPYHERVQLIRDFLKLPLLRGILTDSHFSRRNRLGRLIAFLARAETEGWKRQRLWGLGIDERTALVVDRQGNAEVMGQGAVTLVFPTRAPAVCKPGVPLSMEGVRVSRMTAGKTWRLSEFPDHWESKQVKHGVLGAAP